MTSPRMMAHRFQFLSVGDVSDSFSLFYSRFCITKLICLGVFSSSIFCLSVFDQSKVDGKIAHRFQFLFFYFFPVQFSAGVFRAGAAGAKVELG